MGSGSSTGLAVLVDSLECLPVRSMGCVYAWYATGMRGHVRLVCAGWCVRRRVCRLESAVAGTSELCCWREFGGEDGSPGDGEAGKFGMRDDGKQREGFSGYASAVLKALFWTASFAGNIATSVSRPVRSLSYGSTAMATPRTQSSSSSTPTQIFSAASSSLLTCRSE